MNYSVGRTKEYDFRDHVNRRRFVSGWLDATHGRPFRPEYEGWDVANQRLYEEGRQAASACEARGLVARRRKDILRAARIGRSEVFEVNDFMFGGTRRR